VQTDLRFGKDWCLLQILENHFISCLHIELIAVKAFQVDWSKRKRSWNLFAQGFSKVIGVSKIKLPLFNWLRLRDFLNDLNRFLFLFLFFASGLLFSASFFIFLGKRCQLGLSLFFSNTNQLFFCPFNSALLINNFSPCAAVQLRKGFNQVWESCWRDAFVEFFIDPLCVGLWLFVILVRLHQIAINPTNYIKQLAFVLSVFFRSVWLIFETIWQLDLLELGIVQRLVSVLVL
jgi:hypothetical protein